MIISNVCLQVEKVKESLDFQGIQSVYVTTLRGDQFKEDFDMTVNTQTTDRKAMAKALAEHLGTEAKYMGIPSYAYQVGDYTVNHDGSISGDDLEAIRPFLEEHGYIEVTPAAEAEEIQETKVLADDADEKEMPADSEAEPITQMDISIPARDVTAAQLKNLVFMLNSRQTIINRMTQSDCLNIPDCLIEALQEDDAPQMPEAFTNLLDACIADGLTGFDFRDGKVSMTFPFDETQPTRWTAYANLLNRIYDAATKATRVFPDRVEPDPENEKYYAHVWLQRLGYHGADFKTERKILLGHLKGYCAFVSGEKMQAHKDKYTAIRRERRQAEQEAPVPEVEVTDHD